MVMEGALHLAGVPNGGFDIDPYEINNVVAFVELTATVGAGGMVDIPVTLTKTEPDGGIIYLFAATDVANGQTSLLSEVVVVEYDDSSPAVSSYRINAGGSAVAGTPNWLADDAANLSAYSNTLFAASYGAASTATIDMTSSTLPPGTPAELFASERWDSEAGSEMQWSFPVEPGEYEVRLYFAESYQYGQFAGSRIFDVTIEGVTVLDDFDIYATAGGNTAWMESFTVTSDMTLDIDFARVVQNPLVNAIEILPALGNTSNFQAATLSGDLDGNGKVNGRDFLYWLTNYGTSTPADGNGDGKTDENDLNVWYADFASTDEPVAPLGKDDLEEEETAPIVVAASIESPSPASNLAVAAEPVVESVPEAEATAVPPSIGWYRVDGSLAMPQPKSLESVEQVVEAVVEPTQQAVPSLLLTTRVSRDQAVEELFDLSSESDEQTAEADEASIDAALAIVW